MYIGRDRNYSSNFDWELLKAIYICEKAHISMFYFAISNCYWMVADKAIETGIILLIVDIRSLIKQQLTIAHC